MLDDYVSKESLVLGAVAGGLTFGLTFIVGLLGGVGFGTVLFRSFLFTLLLFVLGTGAGLLLEKVVPGIWGEIQSSPQDGAEGATYQDSSEGREDVGGSNVDYVVDDAEYSASGEGSAAVEDVASKSSSGNKTNKGHNVVGDYLIVDDKKFPNDPEDYAKAIRTMMKKDE